MHLLRVWDECLHPCKTLKMSDVAEENEGEEKERDGRREGKSLKRR